MTSGSNRALTAADVLRRYRDEDLPEFVGLPLDDVDQRGNFGDRPIQVAAVRGDVDELRALIEGGADVNAPGEMGNAPLHQAVLQERSEAVRFLLDKGADRTIKNEDGRTAFDIAKTNNITEMLELLMLPRDRHLDGDPDAGRAA